MSLPLPCPVRSDPIPPGQSFGGPVGFCPEPHPLSLVEDPHPGQGEIESSAESLHFRFGQRARKRHEEFEVLPAVESRAE
jgi:hypothetical protein